MVKDICPSIDKLGTLQTHNAPNLRQAKGGYPVWGMGQPTREGLLNFVCKLRTEGHEVSEKYTASQKCGAVFYYYYYYYFYHCYYYYYYVFGGFVFVVSFFRGGWLGSNLC